MRKYVAEFRVEGGVEQPSREARPSQDIVEKKRQLETRHITKGVSVGVGAALTASRLYAQYVSASNSIVGDSVAQRQFDNRMAYLNEGLSIFATVGIAAIVSPIAGLTAAIALTTSYGLRASQTMQQNTVKQASWEAESIINQQKQNRLVRDVTGIRV